MAFSPWDPRGSEYLTPGLLVFLSSEGRNAGIDEKISSFAKRAKVGETVPLLTVKRVRLAATIGIFDTIPIAT